MFERIKSIIKRMEFRDLCAPLVFLVVLIPASVFRLMNKMRGRALWLVAEEGEARDNGYYFYKYVRENHPTDYCFYAIKPQSAGYEKAAKLGNVIKWGSLRHWLYYMSASLNISSQTSGTPSAFFWFLLHGPLGMYKNRVFLQHGITLNDALPLYYKKTHFKYFICGAEPEFKEISSKFGYPNGSVVLTGFPRWDYLRKVAKNKVKPNTILIMPTWRKYLEIQNNKLFNNESFMESDYFKAWNGLLNDGRFLKYIEDNNITVYFYPHQNVQKMIKCFSSPSESIKIVGMENDILDYLATCSLLITDYSSVMFDFAYLKKPVICYQFDQKDYREKQHGEGYFSYENDGFGPIAKNVNEVLKAIKKMPDWIVSPKYVSRIEKYFGDGLSNGCSKTVYNVLRGSNQKIKVLHVNNSMNIGGIETSIMNAYRRIDRSRFDYVFITYKKGRYDFQEEIEKLGGKIVRVSAPGRKTRLRHLLDVHKIIRLERPDVVHCYTYFDSASVMLVARFNRVPIRVTHSHIAEGFPLSRKLLHNFLAWIIRKNANVMLACGNDAGMALYKKPCFRVLRNGINLADFSYNSELRRKIRKELNIANNEIVIGHVGRLADVKNHKFLLEIARHIIKQNKNYKFFFVGDGPLKGEIEKKIKRYHLERNVFLLGGRSDVACLYNAFDLIVFPSLYEGLSMTLIEAQANGLPVIASSSIDLESKLNDNFEFLNLDDGAERWTNEIMDINKKRQKPSRQIEEYSIEKIVARIEEIYES